MSMVVVAVRRFDNQNDLKVSSFFQLNSHFLNPAASSPRYQNESRLLIQDSCLHAHSLSGNISPLSQYNSQF